MSEVQSQVLSFLRQVNQHDARSAVVTFNETTQTTQTAVARLPNQESTPPSSLQGRVSVADGSMTGIQSKIAEAKKNFKPENYSAEELKAVEKSLQEDHLGAKIQIPLLKKVLALFSKSVKNEIKEIRAANETIPKELSGVEWESTKKRILKQIDEHLKGQKYVSNLGVNNPIRLAHEKAYSSPTSGNETQSRDEVFKAALKNIPPKSDLPNLTPVSILKDPLEGESLKILLRELGKEFIKAQKANPEKESANLHKLYEDLRLLLKKDEVNSDNVDKIIVDFERANLGTDEVLYQLCSTRYRLTWINPYQMLLKRL